MAKKEHWLAEPEVADFGAAAQYLTLVLTEDRSRAVATRLADAPILRHRATDLLHASALPLPPADDPEVVKDLRKVRKGKKLSPVLLVRGGLGERALKAARSRSLMKERPGCRVADLSDLGRGPFGAQG